MTRICNECGYGNPYWRNHCEKCGYPANGWDDRRPVVNSNTPEPGETADEHARRIRKNTVMGAG